MTRALEIWRAASRRARIDAAIGGTLLALAFLIAMEMTP